MSIFNQIFKDLNYDNIDTKIDNIITQLSSLNNIQPSEPLTSDFISSFIENSQSEDLDTILQTVSVSKERLDRYAIYDEAYRYVPVIKRMMKVYVANILQKNPITGKSLLIRESPSLINKNSNSELVDKAKKFTDNVVNTFDLIIKLKNKILQTELVYGDCYLEVVDVNEESKKKQSAENISLTTLFESESRNINNDLDQMQKGHWQNGNKFEQTDRILEKLSKYLVEVEEYANIPPNFSNKDQSSKTEEDETETFTDIVLKIHKPHNIVVLSTDYGTTLGYFEVSKDDIPTGFNLTQSLGTMVGKITTLIGKDLSTQDSITDRLTRYIIKQALDKSGALAGSTDLSIDSLFKGLDPSILIFIKRLIIEQGLNQKTNAYNRVRVRFIPVTRMVSFTIPTAEFDPYGLSFIDPLVFQSKLYILSQLSNIIMKLSRAAPVRYHLAYSKSGEFGETPSGTIPSQALTEAANFSY